MKNIPQGFYFDGENKRHTYYFDGKKMTGVTTVLGVIAKPALIQWSANMAVDHIEKYQNVFTTDGIDGSTIFSLDNFLAILEEARTAHTKKKEEAGQKGTDVHAIIEGIIKGCIKENDGLMDRNTDENPQIVNFINWALDNKVKFLESEKQLYSKKLFVAGTVDFVCEIDGKVWIGDIKTSSGIYPENFAQMAGYQIMIEENKLYEIAGHIVVNLRKDGTFEEKRSTSLNDYKKFFLACLDIYRIQEKIKGQIL